VWRSFYELLIPSVCPGCDRPRSGGSPLLCSECSRRLEAWPDQGDVRTALAYRGLGARLVQRFKFEARRDALDVLAAALAARVRRIRFDAIVPVARAPERIRSQGHEPVHRLALALGRHFGAPVLDVLERSHRARPQTGLSEWERRRNVAQSFSVTENCLANRRVLLIDDVATTGATLGNAAGCLRARSGAREVTCAAVAATPPPTPPLEIARPRSTPLQHTPDESSPLPIPPSPAL